MTDLHKAVEMAFNAAEPAMKSAIETIKKLQAENKAIRQALAHQPEPIAWMVYSVDGQSVCITDDPTSFSDDQRALPLWPGPFEREWVGLTDEEVETFKQSCHLDGVGYDTFIKRFAIGIEAKLKEKNGG